MAEGSHHLTSTEIDGEPWLRITVMAPATDEATLVTLLDRIEGEAVVPGARTSAAAG